MRATERAQRLQQLGSLRLHQYATQILNFLLYWTDNQDSSVVPYIGSLIFPMQVVDGGTRVLHSLLSIDHEPSL